MRYDIQPVPASMLLNIKLNLFYESPLTPSVSSFVVTLALDGVILEMGKPCLTAE